MTRCVGRATRTRWSVVALINPCNQNLSTLCCMGFKERFPYFPIGLGHMGTPFTGPIDVDEKLSSSATCVVCSMEAGPNML